MTIPALKFLRLEPWSPEGEVGIRVDGLSQQSECLLEHAFGAERKTMQAENCSSHQLRKRGHLGKKAPERRKQSVRIRRVAGRQASRPFLIGLKVRRMLKRTSGLNKLMSMVQRMSMEFESKFLDSL